MITFFACNNIIIASLLLLVDIRIATIVVVLVTLNAMFGFGHPSVALPTKAEGCPHKPKHSNNIRTESLT